MGSNPYTGFYLLASLIPILLAIGIAIALGFVASSMAEKRGLRKVPAFWAGFFGNIITLFIIAMFPKNDIQ